jgi:site-specific recombinase XerD
MRGGKGTKDRHVPIGEQALMEPDLESIGCEL